ncbi:hypothetical protein FSP39_022756 [Pinctada imbricata]|uniref:CCHC-type domain-containing protein n=1 Tax=Pinctada imbricata TaxID=66713 RepID=A0AA89BZ98_PINIB|nr:hypothetical protein FSP39_022756 [Pinctada imbricata]
MTQEEMEIMASAFEEMNVKPSVTSKEDFQKWLLDFSKGARSREPKSDGTSSQPQQPSSVTSTHQPPRLPTFSGDKKGDATYDLWKYEVECLMRDKYSDPLITQAIRRSVKGEAARVIMRLGSEASVIEIIDKLESIFGSIDTNASVLSEFFSARQRDDEDVASWGCRLEDLMNKAMHLQQVRSWEANEMLNNMFYEGLKPSLKDTIGHIFDKTQDFDELRRAVRRKEEEMRKRKVTSKEHVKSVTSTSNSDLDELKAMVQKLTTDMTEMKKDIAEQRTSTQYVEQINTPQHQYNRNTERGNYRGINRRPYNYYGRGQQRYQQQFYDRQQYGQQGIENENDPICYRCGQEGHLALGCRVRLDHMRRQPSNFRRPASRRGR